VNQFGLLQSILGSAGCCRVLLYLHLQEESWAREIARFWGCSVFPVQKQLEKLEDGGVLRSRMTGRTRVYAFRPSCPVGRELRMLLQRFVSHAQIQGDEQAPLNVLKDHRSGRVRKRRRGIRGIPRRRTI
jgi:predicted transcriptional regulator